MGIFKPLPPRLQRGHPLARGLVGAWEFTAGSGLTAYDSSGCGNHGTLVGGAAWTGGPAGSAVKFDGSTGYISVPYSPSLGMTTDYSLVALVNTAMLQAFNCFFMRGDNSGGGADEIELYSAETASGPPYQGLSVAHNRNAGTFCYSNNHNSSTNVSTATWGDVTAGLYQLLVDTYTAKTWSLYLNGVLKGTASGSGVADPLNAGRGWQIGAALYSGFSTPYFVGAIGFARIYNRALSAAEIAQLYQMSGP